MSNIIRTKIESDTIFSVIEADCKYYVLTTARREEYGWISKIFLYDEGKDEILSYIPVATNTWLDDEMPMASHMDMAKNLERYL